MHGVFVFSWNHETLEQREALEFTVRRGLLRVCFRNVSHYGLYGFLVSRSKFYGKVLEPSILALGLWLESWVQLVPVVFKENRQSRDYPEERN